MVPSARWHAALAAVLCLAAVAACSSSDTTSAPTTSTSGATTSTTPSAYPLDDSVHLNQIQVLGTHNSYHVEPEADLLAALRGFSAELADSIEYSHPPLGQQFDDEGIRQIELDVFADPEGGLYANRAGETVVGRPAASGLPELDAPGFKVMHVQDIDFGTTCLTFVACLTVVRDWSHAHPGHVPIMIDVEAKDDPIPDPGLGFVTPHPIGAPELDALDAEIRSVLAEGDLVTPDDVRGSHATLEEAVLEDGWPTLGESRGKILFVLDNEDAKRDAYIAGHPSLEGRVLFTSSPAGTPEAAFMKLNDPITDEAKIHAAVAAGYVVRTRSDADTVEARSGDPTMRDAALRSGAQWVSTDYPVPDPRFTDFSVAIPGGTPARCNPVNAPPDCTAGDIENPAHLTSR